MGADGVLETLERLRRLVEERGECKLLCLLNSPGGLEIVSDVDDYVTIRGMLKVAEETVIDSKHVMDQMMHSAAVSEAREAVAVMSGFKKPPSKAN